MEKYSLEQAEDESLKIKEFAKESKERRKVEGEEKDEPTSGDYKTADRWVEDEKYQKEAEATLKNLKNIDLSTPEGRIDVVQMYKVSREAPKFEGTKDGRGRASSFGGIIEQSATANGKAKGEIVTISKENILKDFDEVSSFYGHSLVKRPELLRIFMIGWDRFFKDHPELIGERSEEVDKFLFSYILYSADSLSSQMLNGCLPATFLFGLYKKIKDGEITEEEAKTHPNYALIEELVLKVDKQQKTISDILFKMLSSYIHTNDFTAPSLGLETEEKEDIFEKDKEASDIGVMNMKISKTLTGGIVRDSVESFSFNPELEAEIKGLMEYIDFFQPILDKYNSMMVYSGVDTKKE